MYNRARAVFRGVRPFISKAARATYQGARATYQGAKPMFARARGAFGGAFSRPDTRSDMQSDTRSAKLYLAFSRAMRSSANAHIPAITPDMVAYVTHMPGEMFVMLYSQRRIAVVIHMPMYVNHQLGPIRVQRYGPAYANVGFVEHAREIFNRRGGPR